MRAAVAFWYFVYKATLYVPVPALSSVSCTSLSTLPFFLCTLCLSLVCILHNAVDLPKLIIHVNFNVGSELCLVIERSMFCFLVLVLHDAR